MEVAVASSPVLARADTPTPAPNHHGHPQYRSVTPLTHDHHQRLQSQSSVDQQQQRGRSVSGYDHHYHAVSNGRHYRPMTDGHEYTDGIQHAGRGRPTGVTPRGRQPPIHDHNHNHHQHSQRQATPPFNHSIASPASTESDWPPSNPAQFLPPEWLHPNQIPVGRIHPRQITHRSNSTWSTASMPALSWGPSSMDGDEPYRTWSEHSASGYEAPGFESSVYEIPIEPIDPQYYSPTFSPSAVIDHPFIESMEE
ncbi:hypothetical protein IAR55_001971 [Kwoniella newhampshirensis]|uniref:Uncharacterized protein n=1 Tax=Kwoniella newhampshirensis TaxID=1651941 RepID=A0AAW0Z3M4_9TREE